MVKQELVLGETEGEGCNEDGCEGVLEYPPVNYNGVEPVTHPQLDRSKFVLSNRFRLSFRGC